MTNMVRIRLIGGPTTVLDIGGLRLVTDPTFDPPGSYPGTGGPTLVKLSGPAAGPEDLGHVDAVLLSHDQHADNLDDSGRDYLSQVPLTLTNQTAAERLVKSGDAPSSAVLGLDPWEHFDIARAGARPLRVTAVPARHGPKDSEPYTGPVIGFVLTAPDVPTVYVSGDNAWLGNVRHVAERFADVDIAMIFAGAARLADRLDGELLTVDSWLAAGAARILGTSTVVPAHYSGWQHFTQGSDQLRAAFECAGLTDRLVLLAPGESAELKKAARPV